MANWIEKNGQIVMDPISVEIADNVTVDQDLTVAGNVIVGGTTLTETDLAKIDGITNGTGAAAKALVLDANADITAGLRNLSATGVIGGNRYNLIAGGTPSGSANVQQTVLKLTSSIADNTATACGTFTVPNAAHSAMARVHILGSLGAGGAIGANEASGCVSYDLAITRTAGVATVVTFSSAYGSAMANVAGAATITVTAAASAISGAVGATQTFTLDVTINSGSGVSANHTAKVVVELLNANASGVTFA